MTGNVPYYGGRFTPAQAYAAAHPYTSQAPPPPAAQQPPAPPRPREPRTDPLPALQQLYSSGVITRDEYHELLDRVQR
jgi:hypothetical protein